MNVISKIWEKRAIFRNLLQSIYFNFHYLPFKQAIHLPILLYKPHLIKLKGKIKIEAENIKFGMIKMGFRECGVYPNSGVTFENHGGTIIFKGEFIVGNDTYLAFGENTKVEFGDGFKSTAALKLVSYRGMKFGVNVRFGWENLIMDTNFHPIYDITNKRYKKASGEIVVGDYSWFATKCKIMHSTVIPERCIFAMNTTITRGSVMKSYCVMGGDPVRILSENVMRDYDNDKDEYTYNLKK